MFKKIFKKYGATVMFYGFFIAVFFLGFFIGMYGKTAPSLEAIERANITSTISSEKETPDETPEKRTETPAPKYTEITVTATAYCPCVKCSEGYGTNTATGVTAQAGRTIAVDPSVIPYGTEIIINGNTYVAEDCGGAIKGNNKVDIYFDTHEEVLRFGRQELTAYILE